MTRPRTLIGIEAERTAIRAKAIRSIQHILDMPQGRSKDARTDWLAPPPLQSFRRIEIRMLDQPDNDWWVFHPDDCTPSVLWPIDVTFGLVRPGEDVRLLRMRTIRPRQARGYATKFGPFMVRHGLAQMMDRKLVTAAGLEVWLGGQWVDAGRTKSWEGVEAEKAIPVQHSVEKRERRQQASLAIGVALRHRYEWAVALGFENTPTVRLATDPTGIKEVFKLRDLPAGRDRRDALLTWVSDHWRQDRRDDDIERYVRKHVRGATAFEWSGMCGEILPSAYDMDRLDQIRAEREAMRIAGQDMRLREHPTSQHAIPETQKKPH